jgi:hypothetical protein
VRSETDSSCNGEQRGSPLYSTPEQATPALHKVRYWPIADGLLSTHSGHSQLFAKAANWDAVHRPFANRPAPASKRSAWIGLSCGDSIQHEGQIQTALLTVCHLAKNAVHFFLGKSSHRLCPNVARRSET